MKTVGYGILLCFVTVVGSGCSPVRGMQNFFGVGVSAFKAQKESTQNLIDKDLAFCYDQTLTAVSEWGAKAYLRNRKEKYIIAIRFDTLYPRCIDTSKVGFFFEKIEPQKIRIIVKSQNRKLQALVARELQEALTD